MGSGGDVTLDAHCLEQLDESSAHPTGTRVHHRRPSLATAVWTGEGGGASVSLQAGGELVGDLEQHLERGDPDLRNGGRLFEAEVFRDLKQPQTTGYMTSFRPMQFQPLPFQPLTTSTNFQPTSCIAFTTFHTFDPILF